MDDLSNPTKPRPLPADEATAFQQDVYAKQEDLFSASTPEDAG